MVDNFHIIAINFGTPYKGNNFSNNTENPITLSYCMSSKYSRLFAVVIVVKSNHTVIVHRGYELDVYDPNKKGT